MKSALNLFQQSASQTNSASRREWSGATIVRLLGALAALSLVYFLTSHIPLAQGEAVSGVVSEILFFWVLGGVLTMVLLAFSDRKAD
jgi:hypothetical protein